MNACIRVLAIGVAILGLGACAGENASPTTANQSTRDADEDIQLQVSAVDNLFEPAALSAPSGSRVTVVTSNDGENPHTFTITELDVDTSTIAAGESATASFTMPEATVTFYCEIHGDKTMSGTIDAS